MNYILSKKKPEIGDRGFIIGNRFMSIQKIGDNIPKEGLVFYAPLKAIQQKAITGQNFIYTSGHNIFPTMEDGISCLKASPYPSGGYAITMKDFTMPSGIMSSSVSIWFKLENIWPNSNRDTLLWHGGSTGIKRGVGIGRHPTYYTSDFIVYAVGSQKVVYPLNNPIKWHHILATYTTNTVKLYLDGSLISQDIQDNTSTVSQDIKILEHRYVNLCISSARIYNRALSEDEIILLANEFKIV